MITLIFLIAVLWGLMHISLSAVKKVSSKALTFKEGTIGGAIFNHNETPETVAQRLKAWANDT